MIFTWGRWCTLAWGLVNHGVRITDSWITYSLYCKEYVTVNISWIRKNKSETRKASSNYNKHLCLSL